MALAALGGFGLPACERATQHDASPIEAARPVADTGVARSPAVLASAAASPAVAPSSTASAVSAAPSPTYPWLGENRKGTPPPVDDLASRFPTPTGLTRIDEATGSFAAFLRTLPLAAAGTKVLSYSGGTVREGDDTRVAAAVAIDIGTADLQQCADSVLRMHAEWRWARGDRDVSYRAAAGLEMPFSRWARGDRPIAHGSSLAWGPRARPTEPDHGAFRRYLDDVFAWANTGSIARDARKIELADLAPGDFFVLPGGPGHAVLVLDLARGEGGRRAVLLGQGFMPAQSFHVLRSKGSAWFPIDEGAGGIDTPFWDPFPWSSLRRLAP